ncbi:hypothetical protein WICPIJ_009424 [Wickerhamomyces pijperi]|uniref:Mediator of RNA polymerase II transcription subunit 10 n=1 Tax=Wickerhamomyces pijperi TaxID=599730 RepID=A0A9P8TDU6_WICPI|nr:hypothetical protein WICPIJ_009424 [Wickerhamomyces pijperi]
MSQPPNPLTQTTTSLSYLIESFIELGILTHDFEGTDNSRDGLTFKLNETISQLDQIRSSSKQLQNVPIPLDVLRYIEDGRNPDVYTREFVEATKRSNQYLKGKMEGFGLLRDVLAQKIEAEFPELKEVVEDIKKPLLMSSTLALLAVCAASAQAAGCVDSERQQINDNMLEAATNLKRHKPWL